MGKRIPPKTHREVVLSGVIFAMGKKKLYILLPKLVNKQHIYPEQDQLNGALLV